jgi:hypothetical protein
MAREVRGTILLLEQTQFCRESCGEGDGAFRECGFRLCSTAFFASLHDGGVQAVTQIIGHLVDLMATIDLNRLLSRVEDDFAVAAFLQVQLDFSAGLGGNGVVD